MKSISKKVLGLLICSSVILSSLSIGAYAEAPGEKPAEYAAVFSQSIDLTDMSAWYGANAQAAGTYSGSYYDQLSDDAKEFYNKFMTKFENGDTPDEDDANYPNIKCYNIDIKKNMTCDSDDDSVISAKLNSELNNWAYPAAYSAYYALVYDHPELTWMDGRKSIQILSELKGIKSNGTYSGEITLRLGLSENVIPEATPAAMSSLISAAKSEMTRASPPRAITTTSSRLSTTTSATR